MDRAPFTALLAATDFVILAVVLKSLFLYEIYHNGNEVDTIQLR